MGVPKDFAPLVLVAIDQSYPFDVSIGILDTVIWAENMLDRFWVELRDRENLAGNVTVNVSKSVCSKAQETDNSMELRADLKVIQSSFVIKNLKAEDQILMVLLVTNSVYSIFNGVGDLKSVEFIGFRTPTGDTFTPLVRREVTESLSNFTDEFGAQHFECLDGDCIIMDLILTAYSLDLQFYGMNFDDSLHYGLMMVAEMVAEQSGYEIRAARSVRPANINSQDGVINSNTFSQ